VPLAPAVFALNSPFFPGVSLPPGRVTLASAPFFPLLRRVLLGESSDFFFFLYEKDGEIFGPASLGFLFFPPSEIGGWL